MKYSEEQINEANSRSIVDYFSSHGYQCEKKGRDVHVEGFGGLYITDDVKYYQFSEERGGHGLINCLRDIFNMTFPEAVKEILGEVPNNNVTKFSEKQIPAEVKHEQVDDNEIKKEKTPFKAPERCADEKRLFAYMIHQRSISPEILKELIISKSLYQDVKGNAVFLHFDNNGKAVGAELQGTMSDKRFKGIAAGTENTAFIHERGQANKAFVFESAIDMMSYMQMHPEATDCKFVSMAGLKPSIVKQLAEDGLKIVSCVDNDEAGKKFNNKLIELNIGLQSILHKQNVQYEFIEFDNKESDNHITYAKASINDTNFFFFSNLDDCKQIKNSSELDGRVFVAAQADEYFSVSDECAKENVKDFNELLILKCPYTQNHESALPRQKLSQMISAAINKSKQNTENNENSKKLTSR